MHCILHSYNECMSPFPYLAALIQTESVRADELLQQAVNRRQGLGWRVHGLLALPKAGPGMPSSGKQPVVQDIHTGQRYTILQHRGPGARGCQLDPQMLNQAGAALRLALASQPDLVVVNRFGTSEAEGRGLLNELLDLVAADIPVLTIVTDRYLDAWRQFVGDDRHELPCHATALDAWLDALPPRQAAQGQSLSS